MKRKRQHHVPNFCLIQLVDHFSVGMSKEKSKAMQDRNKISLTSPKRVRDWLHIIEKQAGEPFGTSELIFARHMFEKNGLGDAIMCVCANVQFYANVRACHIKNLMIMMETVLSIF